MRSPQRTQIYADIIVAAVEGGTGYWAAVSGYRWDCDPADTQVILHECDDDYDDGYKDDGVLVTIDTIAKGIAYFRESPPGDSYFREFLRDLRNNDWDSVDFDAGIADQIVQAGLFDEVRYG